MGDWELVAHLRSAVQPDDLQAQCPFLMPGKILGIT